MNQTNQSKNLIKIEKISKFLFFGVTFLLPFFFLFKLPVSIVSAKGYFFFTVVLISFVCWLLARLIDAKVSIPKTPIVSSTLWLTLAFIVSSLISPVVYKSFWGSGFEFGTALSVIMLTIYGFLGLNYLQDSFLVKKLYKYLLVSFSITTILSFVGFFLSKTKIGIFLNSASRDSFVGSWNDLAIFAGGVAMVLILALYTTVLSKINKIILNSVLLLILIVLALINFPTVWMLLGIFSLLVFVYIMTFSPTNEEGETQRKIPTAPFVVIIVCLVFLLGSNLVSNFIVKKTGLTNIDIKPSLSSTANIFAKTVSTGPVHALFGFGPNRFSTAWSLYKPLDVNQTEFWNVEFNTGYGFLPTVAVTCGILGLMAIIFFLYVFVFTGIRLVFRNLRERDFNFWVTSSFFGALYLWFCTIVYSPSLSIMMLAFLFTSLFVATLRSQQLISEIKFTYLDDPRKSFFGISLIVVLLVASLSGIYILTQKFVSVYYFGKGITSTDITKGESYLIHASSLDTKSDILYKSLSSFYLNRFQESISSQNPDNKIAGQAYEFARSYADNAIKSGDSTSSINWRNLGDIYALGLSLKNTEAYDYAVKAYDMAKTRDPRNPISEMSFAQLEYTKQNYTKAIDYINESLKLKPNYIDAYALLARINHLQNKDDEAIKVLDTIIYYYPSNEAVYRSVGSIAFDLGLYQRSVIYLENSLALNRSSLETAGMLVRAYRKAGNTDASTKLLESMKNAFVGNEQMLKAIDELDSTTKQAVQPLTDKKTIKK